MSDRGSAQASTSPDTRSGTAKYYNLLATLTTTDDQFSFLLQILPTNESIPALASITPVQQADLWSKFLT